MKKSLVFLAALSAMILAGCKSGVGIPDTYSQLSGPVQYTKAQLGFEVTSCADRQTKLDSESLLKAKQLVQYVFPDSKFLACSRDGFDSIATFELPVAVGVDANKVKNNMAVTFSQDQVLVSMSQDVRNRIKQIADSLVGYDPTTFEIMIGFKNDSPNGWQIYVPSALLNADGYKKDLPIHAMHVNQEKGELMTFTLSNVATRQVARGESTMAFALNPMPKQ